MRPAIRRGAAHHDDAPPEKTSARPATDHEQQGIALHRQRDAEQAAAWCRRRRAASRRLPAHDDGSADPLDALARHGGRRVTDREVRAWRSAVMHVRAVNGCDVSPLVPADVLAAGAREQCSSGVPL